MLEYNVLFFLTKRQFFLFLRFIYNMVMKVNHVQSVLFKSNPPVITVDKPESKRMQINELQNVTPDFNVSIPQKYTKLGIKTMKNGQEIHFYKLGNGHKVTIIPMKDSPAVVKNYVNVGSMNETPDIKGISHFLEHMAFNGTNGENGHIKLETGDSFKKIDEIGGWANASTNYAVTDYVNSSPLLNNKDLEIQIKVIAAMTEDLKLSEDMIEKEKGPVCSEINMILDDPKTIALDQSVRTLFNIKNPADEMIGGSVKHIKNLTAKDVRDYYNKYYTPDNMNLVISGDVNPDEAIKIAAKSFNSRKTPAVKKYEEKLSPINKTVRKDFVSDKAASADIILAFAGPANNNSRENVLYDIAKEYLYSQQAGLRKELRKYNTSPYIGLEKISTKQNNPSMIYIAASPSEENSEKALKSMFNVLAKTPNLSEKKLNELKQKLLRDFSDLTEYSECMNNLIGLSTLEGTIDYITDYEKILDSITPEEVNSAISRYFDINKAAVTIVHPQTTNQISFQGKRNPVNTDNISAYKLPNNYDIGFCITKNNNINYNIALIADKPYHEKPGVIEVLGLIYNMGSASMSKSELEQYSDENNLDIDVNLTPSNCNIIARGGFESGEKLYRKAQEILYNPAISQKNLNKAKSILKDIYNRRQLSAENLYADYDAKNHPYAYSDAEIMNNLDNITLDDLKKCHKYMLENSRGIITANIPESHKEVKNEIISQARKLKNVLPNKKITEQIYTPNTEPKVLTQVNNHSQADIKQVYKFKYNNGVKETMLGAITNSILTNSSIGLFNILREKEHLAYSVYSSITRDGDCGEISCNILTTTDNKEIGEISYDNVQKSIEGFHRQINELKNGKFTDADLENAKLTMKASLLGKESTLDKLQSVKNGLDSVHGITYENKLYNVIDSITKDDVINYANIIFKNPPVYAIAASKDTLNYNKEYLESLETRK